ncbi:MAG: hypothetical protein HC834_00370 [Rhodospirillales bacterium]|nr:hypothetical protein [Rhodospirillales bacterium]
MIALNAAEQAFYADLTRLLMQMRGEPLKSVEAAIEGRFREFVRCDGNARSARLEISHSYTLHDDAEPWIEYATEYRIAALPSGNQSATEPGGGPAVPTAVSIQEGAESSDVTNVIPFPALSLLETPTDQPRTPMAGRYSS